MKHICVTANGCVDLTRVIAIEARGDGRVLCHLDQGGKISMYADFRVIQQEWVRALEAMNGS